MSWKFSSIHPGIYWNILEFYFIITVRTLLLVDIVPLLSYVHLSRFILLRLTFITLWTVLFQVTLNFLISLVALEVVQQIYEAKDDWASLFRPSDFFQKYK